MNINSIVSFKANTDAVKSTQKQTSSGNVATNPLQTPATKPTIATNQPNITPDYNIKVPLKYTDLGEVKLPGETSAHLYKLENGQRVVIIPKKGPTVVKTYVNVGSMNEPDNVRGISHFIEHNLFNGSDGLEAGEFFATVNKLGASTNASTGFAATDYYIESNLLKKKDLETEVKIHAEMLETPKFAENMLAKEKGPVTSEISMILDDPDNLATNKTIKSLYNINSTSTDVIGGTVANINALTRNDVVDYYKRNYYPANMTTVITGEVEPEQAMGLISKYFHSHAVPTQPRHFEKLTPIDHTVRTDLTSDKTKAAIVSIGFNGPQNTNTKDKILLDAFQFFLVGSNSARLNKSLEEIQTNAFVSTERISTKPEDHMVVLFSTQTGEENTQYAIDKVSSEIADLEKNPPTDKELEIVKKKMKLNLAQVFESSATINTVVGTAMLDNDLKSVQDFEKVIDNLTSQDIVDFAKKYFDTNKCAITVVHPTPSSPSFGLAHKASPSFGANENNHKVALDTSKMRHYRATNNIEITTNNIDKELATFNLSLSAPVPADVKPGVSNILAIMLNRGSKYKDEKTFFADLEGKGIQANFDANRHEILVSSMFLPTDGAQAMHSAKEVLLHPRFDQENLEYAKNYLKETLQSLPANTQEAMLKEMFNGQFYGTTSKDVLRNIDNIQLSDVMGLYKYVMANSQGEIAMSGPFDKHPELQSSLFKELTTDFPTLKPYKPGVFDYYKPVQGNTISLQADNKSQAEIQMGYKYKTNNNMHDTVAVELLNTILGGTPSSRLFQDLREKQKLAYHVSSKLGSFDNSGILSLYIKTTTDDQAAGEIKYDNVQRSIEGFKTHIRKLTTENVTDEELESAKLTLKNRILDYNELTADKNLSILLGMKSYYGADSDNKELDMIDSITTADIKAAANYIFNSNPTIAVVATKNTLNANKGYLATQGNVING